MMNFQKISAISDARLIWGGDETINKFKEFRTPERLECFQIDIHFQ